MELLPLNASHDALLRSLQLQDDVWEFVGPLPEPEQDDKHRLFAVMEGQIPIGIGGLIRSQAFDGKDFDVLCALRSEAQRRGLPKRACQLRLTLGFDTANVGHGIALVFYNNERARPIAKKI